MHIHAPTDKLHEPYVRRTSSHVRAAKIAANLDLVAGVPRAVGRSPSRQSSLIKAAPPRRTTPIEHHAWPKTEKTFFPQKEALM
eukprot:6178617-Pleurochrysis_carterae.AAC.1